MPRGKNYVNNNKGMALQAPLPDKAKHHKKKHAAASHMIECKFGDSCTRPNCIYEHPNKKIGSQKKSSQQPCMQYLAGCCNYTSSQCNKRHPPKSEVELLIIKYKKTSCRFGNECRTNGCLYKHPYDYDNEDEGQQEEIVEEDLMTSCENYPTMSGETINSCFYPPPVGAYTVAQQPPYLNNYVQQQQQQQQQQQAYFNTMGGNYPSYHQPPANHYYYSREQPPIATGHPSSSSVAMPPTTSIPAGDDGPAEEGTNGVATDGSTNNKGAALNFKAKEYIPGGNF